MSEAGPWQVIDQSRHALRGDQVEHLHARLDALLRIGVESALWRARALPLRWTAPEYAPQLEATGVWADATSKAITTKATKNTKSLIKKPSCPSWPSW